jgi:phosphoribosylaminoimidazole-succinocarboxamide synthase
LDYRKGKILNDGISEKVYSTNDPDHNIVLFKDEIRTAGRKKKTVKNLGQHVAAMTKKLCKFLESYQVHTSFVKTLKPNEILIKNLEMIPVKLIVWNFASGSLSKRYKRKNGECLNCPVIEYYLKDKNSKEVMINTDHICAFDFANLEEIETIDRVSRKTNAVLKSYFNRRNLELAYFTLEFGRHCDQIFIGNAFSPLNSLLYDVPSEDQIDADRFCIDKGEPGLICDDLVKRITKS